MGNTQSTGPHSASARVRLEAKAQEETARWKASIDALASIDLSELSKAELEAIERVLRQEVEFNRKEGERLR